MVCYPAQTDKPMCWCASRTLTYSWCDISTSKNCLALFPEAEHVHTFDPTEKHEHVDQIYPQYSQLRQIAPTWKKPRHPSTVEWITMLSYIHVTGCCYRQKYVGLTYVRH